MTHELIGHRLWLGRTVAHVARLYDEGIQAAPGSKPYSKLRESVICGSIRSHGLTVTTWTGDGVDVIHNRRVVEASNGHPVIANAHLIERWKLCPKCWAIYNNEPMTDPIAADRS